MGAMGPLGQDQRYVVTIEVLGPQGAETSDKINKLVDEIKKAAGKAQVTVKLGITGKKA